MVIFKVGTASCIFDSGKDIQDFFQYGSILRCFSFQMVFCKKNFFVNLLRGENRFLGIDLIGY